MYWVGPCRTRRGDHVAHPEHGHCTFCGAIPLESRPRPATTLNGKAKKENRKKTDDRTGPVVENRSISRKEIFRRIGCGRGLTPTMQVYLIRLGLGDPDACHYCKAELNDGTRTIDHKVPRSMGGTSYIDNLVLACVSCNNKKGNRDYDEFMAMRYRPEV